MSTENLQTVGQAYEALGRRDIETALTLFDNDIE
jgi:ketosteroid isomerase-like protein